MNDPALEALSASNELAEDLSAIAHQALKIAACLREQRDWWASRCQRSGIMRILRCVEAENDGKPEERLANLQMRFYQATTKELYPCP